MRAPPPWDDGTTSHRCIGLTAAAVAWPGSGMPAPNPRRPSMTATNNGENCPSPKQLAYLRSLADRAGQTFTYPRTAQQASREIRRPKAAQPSTQVERAVERRDDRRSRVPPTMRSRSAASRSSDTARTRDGDEPEPVTGLHQKGQRGAWSGRRPVFGQRGSRATSMPDWRSSSGATLGNGGAGTTACWRMRK
jgi:hypothetical protein